MKKLLAVKSVIDSLTSERKQLQKKEKNVIYRKIIITRAAKFRIFQTSNFVKFSILNSKFDHFNSSLIYSNQNLTYFRSNLTNFRPNLAYFNLNLTNFSPKLVNFPIILMQKTLCMQ